ncbi:hypothetical protein ACWEP8_38125 [Streptomyces hydrogenans]
MQVAQEVLTKAEKTCGTEELEPGLERGLKILKGNSEFRGEFEDLIISLIDTPQEGVVEIVSFLMHDLRWEAVKKAVGDRILHPKGDVSNIRLYEAMLDAFSDSWRDRDLFMRFSGA